MFFPDMILASTIWFASLVTINLMTLHNPSEWFKFLNNIIGTPTFSLILWLGRSDVLNVFRNSEVNASIVGFSTDYDPSIESELRYSFTLPGINDRTCSLISSTISIVDAKIDVNLHTIYQIYISYFCQKKLLWTWRKYKVDSINYKQNMKVSKHDLS